jgi:hypothetical protein
MMHGKLRVICSISLFSTGPSPTFTEIDNEEANHQVDEGAFHQIGTE